MVEVLFQYFSPIIGHMIKIGNFLFEERENSIIIPNFCRKINRAYCKAKKYQHFIR